MASVDDALRIAVRENRDFAISTLLELVALDSLGPNESEAQRAYLRAAQMSGLEAVLVPIPIQELERHPRHAYTGLPYFDRPNVEVRLAGGAASPLIFNSHIDTVNALPGKIRQGGSPAQQQFFELGHRRRGILSAPQHIDIAIEMAMAIEIAASHLSRALCGASRLGGPKQATSAHRIGPQHGY